MTLLVLLSACMHDPPASARGALCEGGAHAYLDGEPFLDLGSALKAAEGQSSTITLCPGLHHGPFQIDAKHDLELIGSGVGSTLTTAGSHRVLTIAGQVDIRLTDLTIMGGTAYQGGNLLVDAHSVTLDKVVLREGVAVEGGAGWIRAGALQLNQVEVRASSAQREPGLFLAEDTPTTDLEQVATSGAILVAADFDGDS